MFFYLYWKTFSKCNTSTVLNHPLFFLLSRRKYKGEGAILRLDGTIPFHLNSDFMTYPKLHKRPILIRGGDSAPA